MVRLLAVALLVGSLAVSFVPAQQTEAKLSFADIVTQAKAMADYFKVTNRPTTITTNDANNYISKLPGFSVGSKGLSCILAIAPIDTVKKLALCAVANSDGKYTYPVGEKEAVMIAVFFALKAE